MKTLLYLEFLVFITSNLLAQSPFISNKTAFSIPRDSGVLILPVLIRYEDIKTDTLLNPTLYKGSEVSETFDLLALAFLRKLSIRIIPANDADIIQAKIVANRMNLLRPRIQDSLVSEMAVVLQSTGCRYILVCSIRVKVGPKGYWDPITGSIGSNPSYTRFHAALLDPFSTMGKPIWTQDLEIQRLPNPKSKDFEEAVQLLLQLLK